MIYQGVDECGDYDDCVCDWWFCEICGLAYEENPVCEDELADEPEVFGYDFDDVDAAAPDISMDGLPLNEAAKCDVPAVTPSSTKP